MTEPAAEALNYRGLSPAEIAEAIGAERRRLGRERLEAKAAGLRPDDRVTECALNTYRVPDGRRLGSLLGLQRRTGRPVPAWIEGTHAGAVTRLYLRGEALDWGCREYGLPKLSLSKDEAQGIQREAERLISHVPVSVADLEAAITSLAAEVCDLRQQLGRRSLLTEAEILDLARPARALTGIYFLIRSNRIVYVGQSVNIHARIASHLQENEKKFDFMAHIEVLQPLLNETERLYIEKFAPEYNRTTECWRRAQSLRICPDSEDIQKEEAVSHESPSS